VTRVLLTPRALAEIERVDRWWRANRRAAPELFCNELEHTLRGLAAMPSLGSPYGAFRRPVRRMYLRGSRYHVYFWHDEASHAIRVLAVWSALRGRGPRLSP
jgi:plasmid stabilization system protein ParE